MPLNYRNDADDSADDEKQNHGPILHQPGIERRIPPALIIAIIILLLLAAGGYYLFRSGVWSKLRQSRTEQVAEPVPAQSPPQQQAATPDTLRSAPVEETAPPPAADMLEGGYTIYVARQQERVRADEEAGRWRDAGYPADVVERDGWYCVAVGRYASREEARAAAEKLKEGLEGGYWISTRP